MSVREKEAIELCVNLAQQRSLKATVRRSLKIFAVTCIGVLVGGLIGWPRGLAFGATAAALCAGIVGTGYKPVDEIIRDDMTEEQRTKLADAVIQAVVKANKDNITQEDALVAVYNDEALEEVVLNEMKSFFFKRMDLSLS